MSMPAKHWGLALSAAILASLAATALPAQDQTAAEAAAPASPPPPAGSVGGLGDVNLFPKRVVIDGRRQIAQVGLYNKTTSEGDYEIKLVDMAMNGEGRLVAFENGLSEADKAKVATASEYLRYSPRRVTLRGGESQLVRIMVRTPPELPAGEYRSHFLVSSVPEQSGGLSVEGALGGQQASGIGVTIRPRFGISIPVIVRIGETTLDVGISDPQVITAPDGSRAIAFTINRSGTRSAFGDVTIESSAFGKPIGISRGIGIYPEVGQRRVVIPVEDDVPASALAGGARIRISYVDDDFKPGEQLAEHSFAVR